MLKIVLYFLLFALCSNLNAQYSVSIGTYHNIAQDMPVHNEYEFNWSSTLYYQEELNVHGDITSLFYDGMLWGSFGSDSYLTLGNQRIFMKLTSDEELASAAFPDTNSMTLVYAGSVDWHEEGLTEIVLDVPFSFGNTSNLQILYVNKHGIAETDSDLRIFTRMDNNSTMNRTVYNHSNGSLPSGDGTLTPQIPITYLRFSSGTDVAISAINHGINDVLAGPVDLTVNFRNYMSDTINSLDIDWSLNGVPQSTIAWTGELFPGQESDNILLESLDMAPGSYAIEATTSAPNGGTDEVSSNDSKSLTIHAGNYIEIGTDDGSFQHAPLRTDMNYGWTSSLYAADSVGINGIIKGIAYNLATNPHTLSDQKIFLTTNSRIDFWDGSFPDETAMQQVFEGTVAFGSTGWNTILFDADFSYADAQNLQIFYQNHSNNPQSPATYFYRHNRVKSTIHHPDNTQFPEQSGLTYDAAPNIRFHFALPNDAGIASIDAPYLTSNTGNQQIKVSLKNNGSETLSATNIKYQIDGGTIQSVNWTGSLAYDETATELALGGHNFDYGAHTLKVWTSAPNGYNDYVNDNDTLELEFFAGSPLSGTYVVGEAPSDFVSLREVFDSLNSPAGINGAVSFEIKPGTYSSQFTLGEVAGSTEDFTISFQSQSGDSTDVIITGDSTDYILRLDGTDYIEFRQLSFFSDSALNYVELTGGVTRSVFNGNRFVGSIPTQNLVISPEEAGSVDAENTFMQNYFEGAQNGLSLYSENGIYEEGNQLTKNRFENQTSKSVILKYQENLTFLENSIRDDLAYAIDADYLSRATFMNNRIEAGGVYQCPLKFSWNTDTTIIANNFIICRETNNGAVRLAGTNYLFVNNTVVSSGSSGYHSTLVLTPGPKMVYNNILVNEGYGYAIYAYTGHAAIHMNYNCLYAKDGPLGFWITDQTTLTDWQTGSGQDANSLSFLPAFLSDTDLHTASYLLDGSGMPQDYVSADIDDETRDLVNPDIGADEFTSPCSGPLIGDYTIGASGDYASFSEAVIALNSCGVSGTVIFSVEEGTYDEQVKIGHAIPGYDDAYNIVFESESGDSTSVTLSYSANSANNYILKLDGADRIVFRRMTIQAENLEYGRVIELANGAHDNLIQGNRILGITVEEANTQQALIYSAAESMPDTGNVFTDNYLQDGAYGFYYSCDETTYGRSETATEISDNTISGSYTAGIYLGAQENVMLSNNRISLERSGDNLAGIQFDNYKLSTAVITGNRIHVHANQDVIALDVGTLTDGLIANNFISAYATGGYEFGVYDLGYTVQFYYNSVLTYGAASATALELHDNPSMTPVVKNNNLVNTAGGNAVQSRYAVPAVDMDYNNLYSNEGYLVNWNQQQVQSMNEWQSISGNGAHSVSVNPVFVSETDLHTRHILLNNTGTPIAEITSDIDGESRDGSTPDIGADEFDSPEFSLVESIRSCIDDIATIDAGVGFDSYLWTTGSDSSSVILDSTDIGYGEQEIGVTVTLDGASYADSVLVIFSSPLATPITGYCINSYQDSVMIEAGEGHTYLWETTETSRSIYVENSGYYNVTVTDVAGCTDNGTIEVAQNTCEARIGGATEGEVLMTNSTLELVASEFCTADYSLYDYLWSTGDTTFAITLDGAAIAVGMHEVSVTIINNSAQNCESADTLSINVEEFISGLTSESVAGIRVYPNPTQDVFYVEGENVQKIEVYNMLGTLVYQSVDRGSMTINLSEQPKGSYLVKSMLPERCVTTILMLE